MTRACRDCKWAKLPPLKDEDRSDVDGWVHPSGVPALPCQKRKEAYPEGATHGSVHAKYMVHPDNVCDQWEPWTVTYPMDALCRGCGKPTPGDQLRFCQDCWDREHTKEATDEAP